ncbi:MAG: hypothetical protein V1745_04610 [Patescibacteria group bacterium]
MRSVTTAAILVAFLVASAPSVASAQSVDAANSRVTIDKAALNADGIDNALVTITARDTGMLPLVGWTTKLYSSRGAADEIRVEGGGITDILGKTYYRVFSLKDGTATFTAQVGATMLDRTVSATYAGGLSFPLAAGDLIKIPDDNDVKTLSDTAVYYYGVDGKRYVFPNEKTYFTWYLDFSKVQVIPIDQMSLIPIGGNATYRPGTRMVKFQTDTKTYMVTRGGVLRWAMTEDVARGWFGADWNRSVDDVSEAFYVNYTFGEPVGSSLDLALDVIKDATRSIDQDQGLTP